MNTTEVTSRSLPIYIIHDLRVDDFEARTFLVKGYAADRLNPHRTSCIVCICDPDYGYVATWLAVLTPNGEVTVEYLMHGRHLVLELANTFHDVRLFQFIQETLAPQTQNEESNDE